MTKASDNVFPKVTFVEGSAPSSPAASDFHLYFDSSDHLLKWKNSAGTVFPVTTGGLADPMTTRGDVIVRNASNVTARLAKGSAGTYLGSDGTDVAYAAVTDAQLSTSDVTTNNASTTKHGFLKKLSNSATDYMDGTGAWSTPAGGGGGSALLGAKTYSTGSDTAWASSSSTTTADIDATNAAITVTIPASGAILAMVELDFTYTVDNHGGFIVLRTGSTDLQAAACISGNVTSGGIGNLTTSAGHMVGFFYVTGLTPGSLTLKVGFRRFATTTLNVYANDGSGAAGHLAGPFVMAVWAA